MRRLARLTFCSDLWISVEHRPGPPAPGRTIPRPLTFAGESLWGVGPRPLHESGTGNFPGELAQPTRSSPRTSSPRTVTPAESRNA